MWKDLSYEWKTAFEEGWIAFKNGSTPIGAALFDENGTLILKNRNRANEKGTINKRISHAEANILRELDITAYNLNELTLYSTMEPCPMCMGTCVMAGIRKLRFAARDPYCGFTYLKDKEPYFMTKNLDYTFADDEMEKACKLACATEYIERFPDKYDTHIEQGGRNVSGGQKQRLCIARALLKKPKILILDDSTSAVDTRTDASIRKAFAEEIPGTTKLIIAQRIASVQESDIIILMDNGQIGAVGNHESLMETSQVYQEIYYSQQKGGLE